MEKITLLATLMFTSIMTAQFFEDFSTHEGVDYGTSFWIGQDEMQYQNLITVGFDINYNYLSKLYEYQDGQFQEVAHQIKALGYASADVLDANQDGLMDFVLTGTDENASYYTYLYTKQADGSFQENLLPIQGVETGNLKVGDVNQDGIDDFVISGMTDNSDFITVLYYGDGNGGFTESDFSFFGNTYGDIVFFDANNDGFTDILISGYSNNYVPETKLYLNNGNDNFTEKTDSGLANVYFAGLSTGDFDNDGYLDVLISGMNEDYEAFTAVYKNDGTAVYTKQDDIELQQVYFGTADFVDFNNDGQLDIFLTGTDSNNQLYAKLYQNNNNNYSTNPHLSNVFKDTHISRVRWSDFDNDGDMDVVVNGLDTNMNVFTTIYKNNFADNFCTPTFENSALGQAITQVSFENINNNSSADSELIYEDFTSQSTPLQKSATYTISVSGVSNDYPSDIMMFIDYNKNNSFDDLDESYYLGRIDPTDLTSTNILSTEVTIPENAITGSTKLRVIKATNTEALNNPNAPNVITSACNSTLLAGQTEDYTVIIRNSSNCSLPSNLEAEQLSTGEVFVSWTAPDDINFTNYYWSVVVEGNQPLDNNIIKQGVLSNDINSLIINDLDPARYDFYIITNCSSDINDSAMLTFEVETLSNQDFSKLSDINIYPNPVENKLNIQGLESLELERLSVYNMMGQQLLESASAETLNVDQLSGGAYILEITTKENKSYTEKFIKK